jgi:hypothetical protein
VRDDGVLHGDLLIWLVKKINSNILLILQYALMTVTLHLALKSADEGPRNTGYEKSSVAISNIALGDHCI